MERFSGLSSLLSFLYEAFQALAPVRRRCFSTKTYRYRRQDRAFAAPVVPDDKVDKGTKGDFKIAMAHEVGTGD